MVICCYFPVIFIFGLTYITRNLLVSCGSNDRSGLCMFTLDVMAGKMNTERKYGYETSIFIIRFPIRLVIFRIGAILMLSSCMAMFWVIRGSLRAFDTDTPILAMFHARQGNAYREVYIRKTVNLDILESPKKRSCAGKIDNSTWQGIKKGNPAEAKFP